MNFTIRKADVRDIDGIMKLMEEASHNPAHPEWFVADDEAYVRAHLSGKGFVITAVSDSDEIAGFFLVKEPELSENLGLYLDFGEESLGKVAVMDSAVVGSAWRGKDLQGKMLEKAEEVLDRERFSFLMCTVHPDNLYSLRNMQRHGYEVKKTVKCYGGLTRYILLKEI
ncbi:MAG: GNAT family N-acetyltransferase [Blautia sp.]|nr:GNAT family N-acetyltransferase [Blautia sp.]